MADLNFYFVRNKQMIEKVSLQRNLSEEEGEKRGREGGGNTHKHTHTPDMKNPTLVFISNLGHIQTNLLPHLHFAKLF